VLSKRLALVAIGIAVLGARPAHAVDVSYAVHSLGGNRWQYAYWLDEFPYATGYGFTVYFDPELYASLTASPDAGSDWDAVVVQPDAGLGAEGFYDAEALFDDATTAAVFRVSFDWLGGGTPGAQPFEVREPAPSFAVIENGTTVVPEPVALAGQAATALSLAALASRARARC
jgi:hypothetical protein